MSVKQTVTINNKQYDAHTGLLIDTATPSLLSAKNHAPKRATNSSAVHTSTQKSLTLKRAIVQKNTITPKRTMGRSSDIIRPRHAITKSTHITRFAPHPVATKPLVNTVPDIGPMKHPSLAKAHAIQAQAKMHPATHPIAPKPSHVIKQEIIADSLAASNKPQKAKKSLKKQFPRVFSVASMSLAVLLLGGYLTYLNLPTISVRVAASQAGVNATYPDYRPDGYRLAGPINFEEGKVTIHFAANAGPQTFTISQTKSSWDSSAVLENRVKPKTDGRYVTYNENGLTIYTYDGNAAWVNGGILYTIEGDAPLSSGQIRHIATSL